ncbi:DUF1289 domain-containing protein [Sodalis-like endosymbiont of Proechinophthirus fluctus]|uniref:DUF1289 domain-containing protein n=1 Tax=Sodalis-like endosymbiont of Proechinophthirus fluctus TaxID=1462730 RepID=UPI00093F32F4|nr:DUF1289 domain-containing protein [Sodalis-like endosymbiont of Proechinophthirus fluctus]
MGEQLEFFSLPNPCRGVCQSDARSYCRGCLRSRDERFLWGGMSDSQKREVLRLCYQRYLRLRRAPASRHELLPDTPEQPSLF